MPEPRPTAVTRPASHLYEAAARAYHAAWDRGWLRPASLPGRVISVGNLTAGGSGKTPAVLELARAALEAGTSAAILTRGYGGTRAGVLRGGAWATGSRARAEEAGDEPALLSKALPEVPVVVGPDRTRGARALLDAGIPIDLWLLDDGFQHRRLARDADLVLLDAVHPLGNGRLLPAGPLRERPEALSRADAMLLTGLRPGDPVPVGTGELLARFTRGIPVYRAWTELLGFTPLGAPGAPAAGKLPGLLLAVSGIANPHRFRGTLEAAGHRVAEVRAYADHHRFTRDDVNAIDVRARELDAVPVVTAKDAIRLGDLPGEAPEWQVAHVRLRSEPDWSGMLSQLLVVRSPGKRSGLAPSPGLR